jgi:hypothetical protein
MRATSFLVFIALGTVGLLLTAAASADIVQLQNGDQIVGTFTQATAGSVSIEVGGQVQTVPQEKVRAIYFGSPPAQPSDVRNGPLGDALEALQGLQSVTAAGAAYNEYASRVVDAQAKVDRFLASAPPESAARGAVTRSMRFYVLASMAWSGRVSGSLEQFPGVGRDPLLRQCGEAQDVLRKYVHHRDSDQTFGEGYSDGLAIALSGLPALWSCASRETAVASQAGGAEGASPPARSPECPAGFALNDTKTMCIRQ